MDTVGEVIKQLFGFRPTLDLSYDMLQGSIWPGFGNLRRFHVFTLKDNNMSRPIPNNLSFFFFFFFDMSAQEGEGEFKLMTTALLSMISTD
jgi:hypothetical protein